MGNAGTTRRGSIFSKQDSTGEDGSTRHNKRLSSRQNTFLEEEEFPPEPPAIPPPEPLTMRQKELLTEMWKLLEEDIAKVGVITFVRYITQILKFILDITHSAIVKKNCLRNLHTHFMYYAIIIL